MAAYIIATYDVTDPDAIAPYVPGVMPLLQKHGAEVLVADKESTAAEGDARHVVVVLKFASQEAAKAWYEDPDYEPLKKMRVGATANTSLFFANEFVPPTE
ncbi:MAG: DUF1330 domain-containing protein [Planctomycetota bacterium]|jgi:uncharacterized protein (DUF1330 family)